MLCKIAGGLEQDAPRISCIFSAELNIFLHFIFQKDSICDYYEVSFFLKHIQINTI